MDKDLIKNSPAINGKKLSIKSNNFALKDKTFTDSNILDISKIKPKKYQELIQKMQSIIQEHLKFNDIKTKINNFSEKKYQLEQDNKILKSENKKIENQTQELNLKYENIKTKIDKNKKSKINLNTKIEKLKTKIKNLQEEEQNYKGKNEQLKQENINFNKKTQIEKEKKETYEKEQKSLKLNINQLLESRTFYSETLSGHKKETNKILFINIGFCIALLLAMTGVLWFAYTFYQDGIQHISQENSYIKMVILFFARGGVGVLLYFVFQFLSQNLNRIVTEMYTVFKGIRDIESSLILAREITFSTETDIEFEDDEEKRNYLSFLKLSVLKNHFINLNSLKKSLYIKDEKQKQVKEES